jgi:4-alpha-glucanotransferase
MNTPGREEGNWRFRLDPGALDAALAARLLAATRAAGR